MPNYDYNTVAQYSCDTGYYLQGNDARSCGGNGLSTVGVWSDRDPSCVGKYKSNGFPYSVGISRELPICMHTVTNPALLKMFVCSPR